MSGTTEYQIFDFEADPMDAIIWRHNNAPNLTALLQAKANWYQANHEQFWIDWFNNVFALEYANDFGCAVWAIILALPVNIDNTEETKVPWGFGIFNQNFNNSNFNAAATNPVFLQTFEKRFVLMLRWWQLVSKGRMVEDNNFLYRLFVPPIEIFNGTEYVEVWPGMPEIAGVMQQPFLVDNLNMTASITLNAPISAALANVIIEYDLLPRPACVKLNITNNTGS